MKTLILYYDPGGQEPPGFQTILSSIPKGGKIISIFDERELRRSAWLTKAAILVSWKVEPWMIDKASKLKVVHGWSAGEDNICKDYIKKKGIKYFRMHSVHATAIAEYVIGVILMIERKFLWLNEIVKNNKWSSWEKRNIFLVEGLQNKTLLVIGHGCVGKEVAIRANAFKMNVIAVTRTSEETLGATDLELKRYQFGEIHEPLKRADYVSIHLPLTKETYHLFTRREIELLPKHSYIINTSRAKILDTQALYEALSSKKIAGAVLDVFDIEPVSSFDPLVSLDSVIVSPHIAGFTCVALSEKIKRLIKNIKSVSELL